MENHQTCIKRNLHHLPFGRREESYIPLLSVASSFMNVSFVAHTGREHGELYQRRTQSAQQLPHIQVSFLGMNAEMIGMGKKMRWEIICLSLLIYLSLLKKLSGSFLLVFATELLCINRAGFHSFSYLSCGDSTLSRHALCQYSCWVIV